MNNKINIIHPAYATKLGLRTRKIDVSIQKIDGSHLDTFGMVIADCLVKDKLEMVRLFQEIFLLANINLKVIMEMLFLTLSRADVWFAEWEFVWKTCTDVESISTIRRVEIITKGEFVAVALNTDDEIFMVHIAALVEPTTILIHPFCQAKVASLMSEKTGICAEYSNFFSIFSLKSGAELQGHTRINDYLIDLLNDKQPPYSPIYSLGLVELKTLKTYIKANLASGFIRPSKSPASALILFVQKKTVASAYP